MMPSVWSFFWVCTALWLGMSIVAIGAAIVALVKGS